MNTSIFEATEKVRKQLIVEDVKRFGLRVHFCSSCIFLIDSYLTCQPVWNKIFDMSLMITQNFDNFRQLKVRSAPV